MEHITQVKLYLQNPRLVEFQRYLNNSILFLKLVELQGEKAIDVITQESSNLVGSQIEGPETKRKIRELFPLGQGLQEYGVQPNPITGNLPTQGDRTSETTSEATEKFSSDYFEKFQLLLTSLGYKIEEISKCTGVVDHKRLRSDPYSYVYLKNHGYILAESFIYGNKVILIEIKKVLLYLIESNLIDTDFSATDDDNFVAICNTLNQMTKKELEQINGVKLIEHTDNYHLILKQLISENCYPESFNIETLLQSYTQSPFDGTLPLLVSEKKRKPHKLGYFLPDTDLFISDYSNVQFTYAAVKILVKNSEPVYTDKHSRLVTVINCIRECDELKREISEELHYSKEDVRVLNCLTLGLKLRCMQNLNYYKKNNPQTYLEIETRYQIKKYFPLGKRKTIEKLKNKIEDNCPKKLIEMYDEFMSTTPPAPPSRPY